MRVRLGGGRGSDIVGVAAAGASSTVIPCRPYRERAPPTDNTRPSLRIYRPNSPGQDGRSSEAAWQLPPRGGPTTGRERARLLQGNRFGPHEGPSHRALDRGDPHYDGLFRDARRHSRGAVVLYGPGGDDARCPWRPLAG